MTLDRPRIHPKTRRGWRAWLERNHAASTGVWLFFYRQGSGKRRLPYADAVEEALCFGWIDSVVKPIDDERYMQLFTPRKRGSGWSRVNKQRVERMLAAGLMHPSGLERIAVAKRDGSWFNLDAVEDLVVPPELARVFSKNTTLRQRFETLGRSARKTALYWLNGVKKPERRAERVATIVSLLEKNLIPTGQRLHEAYRDLVKRSGAKA